jgi:hypothetical protein
MAWQLKTTGVASLATLCVAVSDDGSVVKDYVANRQLVVHANVSVGQDTWMGVNRHFFETKNNGSFDFYGLTWTVSSPNVQPVLGFGTGCTFFVVFNAYTSGSFWALTSGGLGVRRGFSGDQTGRPGFYNGGGGFYFNVATTIDQGTGKVATGISMSSSLGILAAEGWYGLESAGTISQSGVSVPTFNVASNVSLATYGGMAGQGSMSAKTHLLLVTNRMITTAEASDLYNDPFGTLFTSAGGGGGGGGTFPPRLFIHRRKVIGGIN